MAGPLVRATPAQPQDSRAFDTTSRSDRAGMKSGAPAASRVAATPMADLTTIVPVGERGEHEVLRLSASLAWLLPDDFAQPIVAAAQAAGRKPAPTMDPYFRAYQEGVLARVEGRTLALGTIEFLARIGFIPHLAEVYAAERIEDLASLPFFLVDVTERRCLGILGIQLHHSPAEWPCCPLP
jgi:hypothetical protein